MVEERELRSLSWKEEVHTEEWADSGVREQEGEKTSKWVGHGNSWPLQGIRAQEGWEAICTV